MDETRPYKIVDQSRRNRLGVVASSLPALIVKAREKLGITSDVKIVLEKDGTAVDEEYFRFIESNTCFMVLKPDEDWVSSFEYNQQIKEIVRDSRSSSMMESAGLSENKLNDSGSSDGKPNKKKSKIEKFNDAVIECKGNYELLVSRASSIITDQEKDNALLSEENALLKWPNQVRSAVLDLEGRFDARRLDVCRFCGQVHPNAPCSPSAVKVQTPSAEKEKRIFNRRQRWIWLIFCNGTDPTVSKIVLNLSNLFKEIKKKDPADLNDAEKFIYNLEDLNEMYVHFCDSVARIFEELSSDAKLCGDVKAELERIGIFTAPNDVYMALLINSVFMLKRTGEIKYKVDVTPFIPKKE